VNSTFLQMTRRRLPTIMLLLFGAVCVGCRGIAFPLSLLAPRPLVTPAPPSAEIAVRSFLHAWEQAEYSAMYALLAPSSQAAMSEEGFVDAYTGAAQAMTLIRLTTSLQSVLQEGAGAQARFALTAQTLLFGLLSFTNSVSLRLSEGRWGVVWSPLCILPQLEEGYYLYSRSDVPARGSIFDRQGLGLATNGRRVVVGVVPENLEQEEHTLRLLSQILEESLASLRDTCAGKPPHWFVVLGEISAEEGVEHHDTLTAEPGVVLKETLARVYWGGDLAPHVLGCTGPITAEDAERWTARGYPPDVVVGQTGLEAWGEDYLRGEWGGTLTVASPQGETIATLAQTAARQSRSMYTTLDRVLQRRAVELLGDKRGAVVALDPSNGQVLAMASSPSYDLNLFVPAIAPQDWQVLLNAPGQPLLNRATQGQYPPASVFKIVSTAAAMGSGVYAASSPFNCKGLWSGLGSGWTKRCWIWPRQHGPLDLLEGLTRSCDIVFYEVGITLHHRDPAILPRYARTFGLGRSTEVQGLGSPQGSSGEEAEGLIPDDEWKLRTHEQPWTVADSVHMVIGQGYVLVTPIQIAVLVGAVANGGTLYRPQLVWKVGGTPEVEEQFFAPEAVGRVSVTPEHLAVIRDGLWGVANRDYGTARWVFKDFEVAVAGKTGTGENPGGRPHAWFAGYAPADDPQIAIAVLVENSGEGSVAAAPIFRSLVETFLQIEDADMQPSP
jgi:penicillin-binding protein 2